MTSLRALDDYPLVTFDKIRFADTDPMGHVNNATLATFLETGRVEMLHPDGGSLAEPGCGWVIARLAVDFVGELRWPGNVHIGTGVTRVGSSSVGLEQVLVAGEDVVARAETVIVQFDETSRRPEPLGEATRERFARWRLDTDTA
ncbi:acyl-CoA thioesterase [Nocardioides insulae]|uniref:acyl-CoA thioesterase n=1 Tax=Nocardioides insulae TaxID=394734 RepID=UPI0004921939|nr:thioesterase family protein [Nocardioides insulae]